MLERERGWVGGWLLAAWLLAAALQAWAAGPIPLNVAPLAFGKFAAGSGGTITISPGGARSASGGVVLLSSGTGSAAQFSVTGEPGSTYAIGLPADGTVVLSNGSGHSMAVNAFSSSPGPTGQLGAGGSQAVFVGARVSVAAQQPAGSYSGSFAVSLNYN